MLIEGVTKLGKTARRLMGRQRYALVSSEGAGTGAVTAPVAISRRIASKAPRYSQVGGAIHIKHKELVGSINPSDPLQVNNGNTNVGQYRLNPSNSSLFSWLPSIAVNFDSYVITSVRFHYIPTCTTNTPGRVALCWDKDSQDALPNDRTQLSSYQHQTNSAPWAENSLVVPTDNVTRFVNESNTTDRKLVDFGQLVFATYSSTGSVALGDIYVEYGITLKEAQPSGTVS